MRRHDVYGFPNTTLVACSASSCFFRQNTEKEDIVRGARRFFGGNCDAQREDLRRHPLTRSRRYLEILLSSQKILLCFAQIKQEHQQSTSNIIHASWNNQTAVDIANDFRSDIDGYSRILARRLTIRIFLSAALAISRLSLPFQLSVVERHF